MKKIVVLSAVALLLNACSGLNRKTVSYQVAKWDASKYYVVAGEGTSKKDSAQNALDRMQQELKQHTPAAAQDIIGDLMANASVKKTWRNPETAAKHYYSLAVLPRKNAQTVLTPLLNQTDAQLGGLAAQFSDPADPLADLKIAYKMQPLVQRRKALDEVYQFVDENRHSYMPETFGPYQNILKQKMAAVLVGIEGEGRESAVMVTYVVDALNKMGFGVVQQDNPDQVLTVKVQTEVEGYNSKKVNGLIWCTSSAAVSLLDAARGATFSRFNVSQRAGTTRREDSLRRSMQTAGEQAAQEIETRLEAYLKNR